MINVGLDISKDFHEVHILEGQKSIGSFRIDNVKEGFKELEKRISGYPKGMVRIAMESTGHYWKPIAAHLRREGYEVKLINSFHVANFKEIEDNTPNKNDRKDSKIIARLSSYGKVLYANISDGERYSCIKNAYDARRRAINDVVRHKAVIRTLIERHFPEFEKCFSSIWIKTSLTLLMELGFEGFEKRSSEEIGRIVRKVSKGRFKEEFGKEVKKLYENSIGLKEGILEADNELRYRVRMLKTAMEEIKKLEERLEKYLEEMPEWKYLKTIPGVGIVFGSGIIAELGNIRKYKRGRSVVKMAGLNLSKNASGKYNGRFGITKRGRSELRWIAYMIALNLVHSDERVKKFYERKLLSGAEPVSVLIKISDKVLRMIRRLVIDEVEYISEKMY